MIYRDCCRACAFSVDTTFDDADGNHAHECHRMPPSIPAIDRDSANTIRWDFPIVWDTDWCGEFKPKNDPKTQD